METRLRRLVAKFSRHLVLRRRLPARFGAAKLDVCPGAALAYFRSLDGPNWQDLYEFASHCIRPGDSVWDVGANLGVFSFAAAHCSGPDGKILAIEADPWSATLMRRSARRPRGPAAPVEVLCAAVTDRCDLQSFETPEWARAGSHLSSSSGAGEALLGRSVETHPVVTVSLDWLLTRRPGPAVLKIDVEGAELGVLQGAEKMLGTHRPKILMEVFDRNIDAVAELLGRHRYLFYDMSRGWIHRQQVARPVYQTLALPE